MRIHARRFMSIAALLFVAASLSFADEDQGTSKKGEVDVKVHPKHAYVWLDGKPVNWGSRKLRLEPGNYTITVYNYGYELLNKQVTVESGQKQAVDAHLNPTGSKVSGPWGRIQVEGVSDDALVFLNGTTPGFFVGHAGEMNNDYFVSQRLVVPVGTQQMFVVDHKTNQPIWSGPVTVKENQRVVVYVHGPAGSKDAQMIYKPWSMGKKLNEQSRFGSSAAAVTIAVAPVSAHLAAQPASMRCDEKGKLTWTSANAAQTVITGNDQKVGSGPAGTVEVDPKQNTKYQIRAAGPGGVVTQDAAVQVDNTVKASISISNPEVTFRKVGDTIQQQDTANLTWTATNADSVTIEGIGTVSEKNGTKAIQATPAQTNEGQINETQVYKIVAKNDCGGSDTQQVALHITGSIEPPPVVAEATPPPELPHTATPLPLLALFGLASLGTGAFLSMRSKR